MQNSTLPDQPVAVKEKHPADGSDRWTVTGPAGKVCYDLLGNHLALRPNLGEPDSVMGVTLKRVREYALLNEDEIVFGILRNLYHSEIEFVGSAEPAAARVNPPPVPAVPPVPATGRRPFDAHRVAMLHAEMRGVITGACKNAANGRWTADAALAVIREKSDKVAAEVRSMLPERAS